MISCSPRWSSGRKPVSRPLLSKSTFGCAGWSRYEQVERLLYSTTESLPQFFSRVTQNLPRYDQAVDLPGAFVNIRNLRITEPLLSEELAAVTQRTQNFHNLLCDLCTHISRLDLAHRGLKRIRFLIIRHPDRLDHHEPCRLEHNFHI